MDWISRLHRAWALFHPITGKQTIGKGRSSPNPGSIDQLLPSPDNSHRGDTNHTLILQFLSFPLMCVWGKVIGGTRKAEAGKQQSPLQEPILGGPATPIADVGISQLSLLAEE